MFGHLLPPTGAAVLRRAKFQRLLGAKFLADAGKDSVKYAALVGVIYAGGDAFASSLIGLASLIPGVIFALYGGAISDSMPKRVALALAYTAMAVTCVVLPTVFDDSVFMYFMLVFIVISLGQITSPAEQTLLPMVNTEEQLATANSVMGMVSSIGTTVGTAIMAPILLLTWGTDAVFYTAAVLLLIAMTRIFQVDSPQDVERGKRRKPPGNFTTAARWLLNNPSILTMIAVSAIGGMGYQIMSTLAPTYVYEVLDLDPAKTIYVMGVAGFGMLLSLFFVPPLIARTSERKVAGAGFLMLTAGIVGLGLVNSGVIDFLTPINPVHWLDEVVQASGADGGHGAGGAGELPGRVRHGVRGQLGQDIHQQARADDRSGPNVRDPQPVGERPHDRAAARGRSDRDGDERQSRCLSSCP